MGAQKARIVRDTEDAVADRHVALDCRRRSPRGISDRWRHKIGRRLKPERSSGCGEGAGSAADARKIRQTYHQCLRLMSACGYLR